MLFAFRWKHFFYSEIYPRACYGKKSKVVRPEDTEQLVVFKNCTDFELHKEEQLKLSELVVIMQKNLEPSDKSAYTKDIF